MGAATGLVVFVLAGQAYAISLMEVVRVTAAVEVTPLPGAPSVVLGIIDLQGQVVPVFDPRQRLGPAARTIGVDDQFIVVRTARRTVALVVDETRGVVPDTGQPAPAALDTMNPGQDAFTGVVRLDGGLVLIHDIEKFLQAHESDALDQALRSAA